MALQWGIYFIHGFPNITEDLLEESARSVCLSVFFFLSCGEMECQN